MMRRCPQCGSAGDDIYGFCIKCGYEFPKVEHDEHTCPLCGFTNPDEADYCVKCGSPLIFKKSFENQKNVRKTEVLYSQRLERFAKFACTRPSDFYFLIIKSQSGFSDFL